MLVPDDAREHRIGLKLQDPIVLVSVPILHVDSTTPNREALFRRLLELNSELMHGAYGLQGDQVVLSAAQQAATMDFEEFQAMIDEIGMALATHFDALSAWTPASTRRD